MTALLPLFTTTVGRLGLAVAALAFLAAPASAQIVFDDFSDLNGDGNPANSFAFSGGADGIGAGFGPADGQDGAENSALSLGVNPGAGGGFAGAGTTGSAGAPVDISSATHMVFFFRPTTVVEGNLPMTLEINLQEDAAGAPGFQSDVDDEFQVTYSVSLDTDYQFVAIPLASFTDDNTAGAGSDDGFDFTKLAAVVFAYGNLQGPEFAVAFDDILFVENLDGLAFDVDVLYDDFTALNGDGNPANSFAFSGGADGIGAGFGPAEGRDGSENSALALGINPGAGGGFAGAGTTGTASDPVDISGASHMVFFFRPTTVVEGNLPMTLEINLQEDAAGAPGFQSDVDDEFQITYTVSLDTDYQAIAIPLASFTDDNTAGAGSDDGFDFTKLAAVVFAYGNLQGPEFAVAFDDILFINNVAFATAAGEAPESFSAAPVAFPNPTAGAATVTFELASAQTVAVDVFDLLGRRVARVAEGPFAAGATRLDVPTSTLAPGVYVVRVRTDAGVASTRLTVLR